MLIFNLEKQTGILTLRPSGPLAAEDFDKIAAEVDPFIESQGKLKALVIEAPHFPGWESFGAAMRHICFVRDHHKQIGKIALVTDSPLGSIAEHVGSHFIAAELRHFPASQSVEAGAWAAA